MERDRWLRACEAAYPSVYRALLGLGASPADAADALQDAFERAIGVAGDVGSPEGWLFVVARRRWRALRWRSRVFSPIDWLRHEPATAGPGADYLVLRAELGRLTERQREVLVMRYLVGLSQEETAAALGIATGTVAATAHQAAARLRARLGDWYE
ncbi:MAG: sigma-70 family RNA polymerase sigma factor [Candidatus Dormibacteraeota bacterium]|nr:sigma-70 family RNA polymerase sigma factor [Candidatus Dormibacteraeota bacterium]